MLGMSAAGGVWLLCERSIIGYKKGLTMQLPIIQMAPSHLFRGVNSGFLGELLPRQIGGDN
jgi:hypothetical protein